MKTEYGFNSEVWWDDITDFARKFIAFVNKQGKQITPPMVQMQEKEFNRVIPTYYGNLQAFKNNFYGIDGADYRIDRYKITALYIKSFLEVSPFYIEGKSSQEKTPVQRLPNEYFSFELMNLILTAWNKLEEGIRMDANEKELFIILLNHFRLNINSLDVLSLAQIIYYIENKYLKVIKP